MRSTHFVTDPQELQTIAASIDRTIYPAVSLPGQVFQPPYRYFLFYDYGHLQDAAAWKALAALSEPKPVYLIYLDPDYRWIWERSEFRAFGVLKIGAEMSKEQMIEALSRSPIPDSPDGFNFACHKCLVAPSDLSWVIWGDRRFDLAIAAFPSLEKRASFRRVAHDWYALETPTEAVDFIEDVSGGRLPNDLFRDAFIHNYEQPQ